jgi:hypothetical protein
MTRVGSQRHKKQNIICVPIMSTKGFPKEVQPNSHRSYLPNNISDQFSSQHNFIAHVYVHTYKMFKSESTFPFCAVKK